MAGAKIQVKRANAATWTAANTVLSAGEIGLESDTSKFKIGNGSTAWTSLAYSITSNLSASSLNDLGDVTISSAADGDFLRWNGTAWINDAVNLGTDTAGSFVQSLVAGTGITLTNNSGENTTPTIAIGQSVGTGDSPTFVNVTAALTGNASTATTLQTSRNIAGQSFNGSANISIAPTDLTGVTSSAAELNILDGATLSTTELNFVDGVSSAIQTQLNTKAPTASPTFTGTVTVPTPTGNTDASTKAYVDSTASTTATNASTALTNHEADTTNIHGIVDTSILVTTTGSQTLTNKTITSPSGLVKGDVGLGNADNTSDANKPVSTAGQTALDLKAPLASPTFTGSVTVPTPTSDAHAATKAYADAIAAGINWHNSVETATAAVLPSTPTYSNGTSGVGATLTASANARLVMDGANTTTGDRVLVKNQADATQNGIYVVTAQGSVSVPYVLTRASDHDNLIDEVIRGDAVYVANGATNINQGFIISSEGTGANDKHVLGTDNMNWSQFTGAANITAGTGITKTGNTLSIGQSVATDASVTFSVVTAALTGNASTATTLQTARNIAGQSFNGSANISIAPTDLTGVTSSAAELNILDGATLSTAELNILDGVTATTAELNFVDGVTSAIQTQINTKAPLASPTFTGTVTIPTGASITAPTGLVRGDVGLGNVDNTSNATERAASATLTNKTLTSPVVNTPTGIVKGDVGLGSVDNTADTAKPVSTAQQTALDLKANLASPTFTGTVTLPSGTVTSTMILDGTIANADINASAAIDDTKLATISTASKVSNSATTAASANTASAIVARDGSGNFAAGTVTAALSGNASTATTLATARNIAGQSFNGSANISIAPTDLTGVTSSAEELNILDGATLSTAELNFVDGVTSAIQTQINLKAPLASPTFTGTVTIPTGASITAPTGLVKGDVGLGSVDNTADTAKPVSTAQQTALDLKANIASPTFTGTVTIPTGASITAPTGLVKGDVGLGNVTNTSDANKPVSTATQTALDLKAPLASPTFTGTVVLPDNTVALGTKTTGSYVESLVAGTGVTLSNNSGETATPTIAIGQAVATSSNVTFANLTVSGDLIVSGTTTSINTETVTVDDNIIVLNNNATGSPTVNAGIEIERGSSTNVVLRWNETSDKWELTEDGATFKDIATEAYVDAQAIASLDDIGNVTAPTPSSGDFLKYSGAAWVNDAIDLGTDTTGSYVASLVAGTGVTLTNNSGESATPTVTIGQAVGTGDSVTFVGVTAALTGNASTATTLATARNIAGQSFNGSANISIAPTDLTGVTSSAAELNILDGATLTVAELNFVDGVTSAIQTQIDLKAPLASPTFTGTVTVPTPTNGTDAANKTYADGVVTAAKIITAAGGDGTNGQALTTNGSGTLDFTTITGTTEASIISAVGGDGAAGSVLKTNGSGDLSFGDVALGTNTTGNYMTDVSAGTGISITHTPAEGSTATIALADVSTNAQTATYTLVLDDKNKIVEMNVASGNNLTVPPNSSVAFPVGSQINILQVGAGQTTVVQGAGVTVNAAPGLKLRTQYSYATLIKRATNTWVLVGDISA